MKKKKTLAAHDIDSVAQKFKVLSDPSRLSIVALLMDGPLKVSDIVEKMDCSQPNVSKHLQMLYQAQMVSRTRKGSHVLYEISDPRVYKLCDVMCQSIK
jgi:DNA-binding transcriptional ArsR family regulator